MPVDQGMGEEIRTVFWQDGAVVMIDQKALSATIAEILEGNPAQVAQYQAGKEKIFGFFVGQAMKATQGKANPQLINDLLKKMLAG